MVRYEFYHVEDGKISALSMEHEADEDIEDMMTNENLDRLRAEKDAGANYVPLDLKDADGLVHSLKVMKRWTGKMVYEIEPQPDEPI